MKPSNEPKTYKNGINWYGWITPFSGYAIVMMEYAAAMNKLTGDKVSIGWQKVGNRDSLEYKCLTDAQRNIVEKEFKHERIGIIKTTPEFFEHNESDIKIGYTMVENTAVNPKWIEKCNGMSAIFVPAKFLVKVFQDSGCTKPIYVVRQGINSQLFPYYPRVKKPKFIFGTCGWMDTRKNWKEMITAFTSEFNQGEDVELWIKNTNNTFGYHEALDPRVKFIDELKDFSGIYEFYSQLDCFLFPTRGEGAGMPPREAMATGLPVIMTNWSGMEEICNPDYNYPLTPVAIDLEDYRDYQPGFQARIDLQELMYYMRHVYENWEEAMAKGKKASEWMHKDWNWEKCGQEMIDLLVKEFGYE